MKYFAISFKNSKLIILDQTKLPLKIKYLQIKNIQESFRAIKELKVRGAPLIGVFAAYSVYIGAKNIRTKSKPAFLQHIFKDIAYLKQCRPTAVNLSWALDRVKKKIVQNKHKSIKELITIIRQAAESIHKEDIKLCKNIGKFGAKLIKPNDRILTHCNAGFLATSGQGTALSIIYEAHKLYPNIKVYADESRPLLQGSRLTCWELLSRKIKVTLICDSMAAYLMKKRGIDKVIVGADRITKNGSVANKIGTYNVAILCKYHNVPFYVAAPSSSFDLSLNSADNIPIEERDPREVKFFCGKASAPLGVGVWNPAFDTTACNLITAIITEKGIIRPPFRKNIAKILGK